MKLHLRIYLLLAQTILIASCTELVHIGTYNCQLLPQLTTSVKVPFTPLPINTCCDDIPDRSGLIAQQIIDADYDIVVLTEVWTIPDKIELINLLKTKYHNYIYFADPLCVIPGALTPESTVCSNDPDLMLFSKFDFIHFNPSLTDNNKSPFTIAVNGRSDWDDIAFVKFEQSADEDSHAEKGAAMVRLSGSGGRNFDIVFTHLQANGMEDGIFPDAAQKGIRQSQLNQIRQMMATTLSPTQLKQDQIVFMGDFNIDGNLLRCGTDGICGLADPASPKFERQEWDERFGTPAAFFQGVFAEDIDMIDTWEFDTQNPLVDPINRDRGLTSDVQAPQSPQGVGDRVHKRTDYFIHNNTNENIPYAPQYTSIDFGLRWDNGQDLSDHFGIQTFFNKIGDYGAPNISKVLTFDDHGNRDLNEGDIRIQFVDGMQWFLITEPGTYGIALLQNEDKLGFDVFESANVSVPLKQYADEIINVQNVNSTIQTKKFVVVNPPFYIRVSAKKEHRTFKGGYELFIHKALGTSPDDPIKLNPGYFSEVINPVGSTITGTGERWFDLNTEGADSRSPQTLTFQISPSSAGSQIDVYKEDNISNWATTGPFTTENPIIDPSLDFQHLYIHVTPPTPDPYQFRWNTDLLVLHGPEQIGSEFVGSELKLNCDIQTDIDVLGDDDNDIHMFEEISTAGFFDVETAPSPVFIGVLGDFDTGESRSLNLAFSGPIRFLSSEQLNVWLTEQDASTPNDTLVGIIDGKTFSDLLDLASGSPFHDYVSATMSINISYIESETSDEHCNRDAAGNCVSYMLFPDAGRYTFIFNLSRGMQGH